MLRRVQLRRWPELRAALIALAIVVGLVDGCPVPQVGRRELDHPQQRVELERWARRLGRVGIDTTADGLADGIVALGRTWARARAALLWPFAALNRVTQLRQRWKLFPVADATPHRMHVEARPGDGPWELLYRPLDPDHRTLAGALEYRRVRASWNPGTMGPRGSYPEFVDWVAGAIFRREPRYVEVRVRMQELRVRPRGGGLEPTGGFVYEEVRRRVGGSRRWPPPPGGPATSPKPEQRAAEPAEPGHRSGPPEQK